MTDIPGIEWTSDWRRTSPVAVLFFLGRAFKQLLSSFANMAASIAGIVVLVKQHPLLAVAAVLAGVMVFVAIAVLRYWHFQFKVDDERILIRQGVFKKTALDLRFERIQGISTEQSLVYRLLGLVTVRFDTAGSAGNEGALPAVHPSFVTVLRERVERERRPADEPQPSAAADDGADVLVRLDGSEVARIGLTDPRALQVVLLGSAFVPLFGQVFADALKAAAEVAEASIGYLAGIGLVVLGAVVVGILAAIVALFLLGSIIVAFLRYFDYELRQEGNTVCSRAGLLTRKEVVVEIPKIQQLQVVQGLRMRWIGRFRLQALPAGGPANNVAGGFEKLTVPMLGRRPLEQIRERVLLDEGGGLRLVPSSDRFQAVSAYAIWPPVLWVGMLPALSGTVALTLVFGAPGLFCLGWLLLVAVVSWQRWRRRGYLHDDDGLAVRGGFLGYRVDALLFRKAQNVAVTQSPLQRRKGLAGLHVHLASGHVSVPYIDHATARRLRDYILFKAESSRVPWY